MGKIYRGELKGVGGQEIIVIHPDGSRNRLRHIYKHSLDGFQWGYGGSGPADAALSILHDCVGEKEANDYYQDFKWDFISTAGKILEVMEEDIKTWLKKKKEERSEN